MKTRDETTKHTRGWVETGRERHKRKSGGEMDGVGLKNSQRRPCGLAAGLTKKRDELKSSEQDALSGTPLRSNIITSS